MRLHAAELSATCSTLGALNPLGRIYLFGSRADDTKRGGDIDLFLEASRPLDMNTVLTTQYRLSSACDTKGKSTC